MFQQNFKAMNTLLVCPECKNTVDLSHYPNITPGMVVECNHCGMTLLVKEIEASGNVKADIVDEGK
jgi:DNA-directed RNA polymerase subunit RPC12/RpoP